MAARQPPAPWSNARWIKVIGGFSVAFVAFMLLGHFTNPPTSSLANSTRAETVSPSIDPETAKRQDMAQQVRRMEDATIGREARKAAAMSITSRYPDTLEAVRATALIAELDEETRLENLGRQWSYTSSDDGMSGKSARSAFVTSTNELKFDFPYHNPQRGRLQIRRHPRWGNDVIVSLEQGQILCSSYSGCPIRVRFDSGDARTLSGTEPSDNSSETVFLPGYNDLVKRITAAKVMRVEMNVYQEGAVMLEFNVEGFDADELRD